MQQHCCSAHAVDALYYAWHHATTRERGALKVNLLLNRSTKWANVRSHLTYEGRMEVLVRDACAVHVRIPDWAKREQVRASVGDRPRVAQWSGSYVSLGDVRPGEIATITFPIAERSEKIALGDKRYSIRWKGDTVVRVDPPGQFRPLYQRERYLSSTAPMVERKLHYPVREIHW